MSSEFQLSTSDSDSENTMSIREDLLKRKLKKAKAQQQGGALKSKTQKASKSDSDKKRSKKMESESDDEASTSKSKKQHKKKRPITDDDDDDSDVDLKVPKKRSKNDSDESDDDDSKTKKRSKNKAESDDDDDSDEASKSKKTKDKKKRMEKERTAKLTTAINNLEFTGALQNQQFNVDVDTDEVLDIFNTLLQNARQMDKCLAVEYIKCLHLMVQVFLYKMPFETSTEYTNLTDLLESIKNEELPSIVEWKRGEIPKGLTEKLFKEACQLVYCNIAPEEKYKCDFFEFISQQSCERALEDLTFRFYDKNKNKKIEKSVAVKTGYSANGNFMMFAKIVKRDKYSLIFQYNINEDPLKPCFNTPMKIQLSKLTSIKTLGDKQSLFVMVMGNFADVLLKLENDSTQLILKAYLSIMIQGQSKINKEQLINNILN